MFGFLILSTYASKDMESLEGNRLQMSSLRRPFRRPSKCSFCHQRRERMGEEEEERLPPPPPSQIVGRRCEHIKNDAAAPQEKLISTHTTGLD